MEGRSELCPSESVMTTSLFELKMIACCREMMKTITESNSL